MQVYNSKLLYFTFYANMPLYPSLTIYCTRRVQNRFIAVLVATSFNEKNWTGCWILRANFLGSQFSKRIEQLFLLYCLLLFFYYQFLPHQNLALRAYIRAKKLINKKNICALTVTCCRIGGQKAFFCLRTKIYNGLHFYRAHYFVLCR